MQDYKNEPETAQNGQKQFYSLNLTPERIFLIFIIFIILISVIVIAVAFTLNKSTGKESDLTESEYEFLDTITGNEYEYHETLTGTDETVTLNAQTEPVAIEQTAPVEPETVPQPVDDENLKTIVISDDAPEVNVSKKVLYSSSLATEPEKKEPKRTVVETVKKQPVETKPAVKAQTEKVAVKETKKAVNAEKYVIQIASYSTEKAASDVLAFYKSAGYAAYTKSFTKDGKTFYRLRLGPYDSKSKADEILSAVKNSKYGKDSYISKGYF